MERIKKMIKIGKIELKNYRQYRSISIDFPDTDKFNLYVLRAKNGTGKTTLLNSILWCFYGKEHYLTNEEKALPIINDGLVEESKNDTQLDVSVRITVIDDEKVLFFERKQVFVVADDPLKNKKNSVAGQSKLSITITDKTDPSKNSVVIEDPDEAGSIVKQYFDESIFDFYFFDGENLKSYFARGKSKKIKDSIFNISQVTLLQNSSDHVNTMSVERYRQASKISDSGSDLYSEQAELKTSIKSLEDENSDLELKKPGWQEKVDDADSVLIGYAPVRNYQQKRADYNEKLTSLEKELSQLTEDKNSFIREFTLLLNFYPRIKATYDLIVKKEEEGNLPPNIDKKQVQNILINHVKNCPVCNSKLDDKSRLFLEELLTKLDVSSETSNYLMSIKSTLETYVERCSQYPEEKEEILKQEKYLKDEIDRDRKELDKISAFLSNYSTDNDSLNISKIEEDRKYYSGQVRTAEIKIATNTQEINNKEERLKVVEKDIESIESKKENKDILTKQVSVLRRLQTAFDSIKNSIMSEIKDEIQDETWHRFEAMIWKRNTFGSLVINNNYELSVFNVNKKEMTGSLSATEYMALAYSFTLAIHDASGKNCPLVVDSPLGRVSDDNRANMASELLKVSMEKQIIMLFTPDEYSAEVQEIYEPNACSVRDIVLSDDEKEIAKVGE